MEKYFLGLILILTIVCCAPQPKMKSGKRATHNPKSDPNVNDPQKPTPDLKTFCDKKWIRFVELQPKGRETSYEETQKINIKGEISVIAHSIIKKSILDNTGEVVSWKKETKVSLPESGETFIESNLGKSVFIDLCTKGVQINYAENFDIYTSFLKKKTVETVEFNGHDYKVLHEFFEFSKSSENDKMETWTIKEKPYEDVLIKMTRTFLKGDPFVTQNTIERNLLEIKN